MSPRRLTMSTFEGRDAEIELLKSMFRVGDELLFVQNGPPGLNSNLEPCSIHFILKIMGLAELAVQLPPGYPSGDSAAPVKPFMTLRLLPSAQTCEMNERMLSTRFNSWLQGAANTGEPVVFAAIDWVRDELANWKSPDSALSSQLEDLSLSAMKGPVVCLWIVSHHIRSPVKRRLILEWAGELKLGGCSMPGRPGLIVAEGDADNADEYWRRIRGLQWKHIQLRDREVFGNGEYNILRFPEGFYELMMAHQSRFSWLNARGVSSEQYKIVFGIPGRLPH
ncbi:RWD domain-containing protein 2B [Paragonimus heterotremus]|uniref:RWD domain-containing protein 2B n=1 Tax=Paragonimus heterotremus TaxID=100268 RepID=A0A8J4TS57_9TREM|nr:RWD domain-containing protein 2B [Paragonimus heterotremus]